MSVKSIAAGNALGNVSSATAGAWLNAGSGDWVVGVWTRQTEAASAGIIWQCSGGAPASFSALMGQNSTITLWDSGTNQATAPNNCKLSLAGRDSAGATLGSGTSITTNGATFQALRQRSSYEPGGTRGLC